MEGGWNSRNLDKNLNSLEMLPEDIQNRELPEVIIGSDVVSL